MAITIDKLKIEVQVKLPRIPSYLLTDGDDKYHVSEFSKKELRKIGNLWVKELVSKGRRD